MKKTKEPPFRGFDLRLGDRPGAVRETCPRPLAGAHWEKPPQQPVLSPVLTRAELAAPTPVFSPALPPRGTSGKLRERAYRIPDHFARHWFLLLLADRIEAFTLRRR